MDAKTAYSNINEFRNSANKLCATALYETMGYNTKLIVLI